jgi:NAD(P)-dependent dehydrogenase (short-subunit alcohol dehydrogenase family)
MTTLKSKRVVVLGGTSGIGFAVAKAAMSAGASVVVTSSNRDRVARAVGELGDGATGDVADLSVEAQTHALFERIGSFDHLAFTAGESLTLGPLATLDLGAARKAFELRFFGALAAVKHAAPRIRAGGSIVLTQGTAGERPQSGWSVGASICGAAKSLTRALAVELRPLRVNAVSPGFVRSPLWAGIPEAEREAMYRDVGARLLVGRVGEPDQIAEAYVYLMQNGYSTGETVVVDGGGLLT